MNNYLLSKDKEKCCGCGACVNACPRTCLKMCDDSEGFSYPTFINDLCIDCNLCSKVCPIENNNKNTANIKYLAAHSKNREILLESSSGGVFSEAAQSFIKAGGLVCGCTIDNNHQVKHIMIDSATDIFRLRGSKYVQSNISNIFADLEKNISLNKTILFVGTPCQVAAVKNLYKYEKLYCIDVLCHGVPSQKLFDEYIRYLEKKHRGKLIQISFRDKNKYGWSITERYSIKKDTSIKTYWRDRHLSEYFSGFLRNMTQRLSCFSCPFSTIERTGDLTLADYWGVEKVRPELKNELGTSLVLINSEKGEQLFNLFSLKLDSSIISYKEATVQNINFFHPPIMDPSRKRIYPIVFKNGFAYAGKKYMLPKNFIKYFLKHILDIGKFKYKIIK